MISSALEHTAWSATRRAWRAFCSTRRTVFPLVLELAQREKNLADDLGRRRPSEGSVEQQETRARDKRAADRQRLLLAAAQRAGDLQPPLRRQGKTPRAASISSAISESVRT